MIPLKVKRTKLTRGYKYVKYQERKKARVALDWRRTENLSKQTRDPGPPFTFRIGAAKGAGIVSQLA